MSAEPTVLRGRTRALAHAANPVNPALWFHQGRFSAAKETC